MVSPGAGVALLPGPGKASGVFPLRMPDAGTSQWLPEAQDEAHTAQQVQKAVWTPPAETALLVLRPPPPAPAGGSQACTLDLGQSPPWKLPRGSNF